MGFLGAATALTWSIFYLVVIFPIRVVLALIGWLFTLLAYFPVLFILLAITLLMLPWTTYHDLVAENVDFVFRCRVAPAWTNFIRIFFQLIRLVWNPFICWWNALNWFAFGWIQDVIIPISLDGGIVDAIKKAAKVLTKAVRDVLAGWILSGDFLTIGVDWTTRNLKPLKCFPFPEPFGCDSSLPTGVFGSCNTIPCDWDNTAPPAIPGTDGAVVPGTDTPEQCVAKSDFFSNDCAPLCDYWITFFQAWTLLIATFCQDLAIFWKLQGVINPLLFAPYLSQLVPGLPFLNIFSLFGSAQLQDPAFWCFAENTVNAGAAVLHIAWRLFAELIIALINAQPIVITRPDGKIFWDYTCAAFQCLVRSGENLAQIFVDEFLPWNIQFSARPKHPVCTALQELNNPNDPACCIDTTDRTVANRCKIQRLGMLCALDTAFCILSKSVNTLFTLLINIEKVVQYNCVPTGPMDPNCQFPTYYETEIKRQLVEALNLWAPLTRFATILVYDPSVDPEPPNLPACPAASCLDEVAVTPRIGGGSFCLTYYFDQVSGGFPRCAVDGFIIDVPSCVTPGDVSFQGVCMPSDWDLDSTKYVGEYGPPSGPLSTKDFSAGCAPFLKNPDEHFDRIVRPLWIKANDTACCMGVRCEVTVCLNNSYVDSPGSVGVYNTKEDDSMQCNQCNAAYGFRCPNPAPPILVLTDNYVDVDDPGSSIFGMHRLTDCLCVFIVRLLCDPSNPTLPCFSENALSLFQGAVFDFCCLTDLILRGAADLIMGLLELTFSFTSADKFFIFLDKMPYIRILRDNLVDIADCLFKAFQFIDTGSPDSASVGFCLKNILVQIVRLVLSWMEFFIRTLLGLIFLPYFIIELPGYDSFILEPNLARNTFIDIINQFVGEESDSFVNCLCYLLNAGIPIPPLTTEGFCPTCTLGGFVEPGPNTRKRDVRRADGTPVERTTGFSPPSMASKYISGSGRVTQIRPLKMFNRENLNPAHILKKLKENSAKSGINAIPVELRNVDAYVSKRRAELFERWEAERACKNAIYQTLQMEIDNLTLYREKERTRTLPSQIHCTNLADKRVEQLTREERTATRPPTLTVSSCSNATTLGCNTSAIWTNDPVLDDASNACNPQLENGPPCFDLCCLFRSIFRLAGHVLKLVARFLNSLTQEWDSVNFPTNQFPYFLGSECQYDFTGIKDGDPGIPLDGCFENDLRILIQLAVDPIVCVCRIIELLIPNIPGVPAPDLCCALSNAADLIGCVMQIFINAIKALALDGEVASQCPIGTMPYPMGCNVDFGVDGNMTGFTCTGSVPNAFTPFGCNVEFNPSLPVGYPCTGSALVPCNPMVPFIDPLTGLQNTDPTTCLPTGCSENACTYCNVNVTNSLTPYDCMPLGCDPTASGTCNLVQCDLGVDGDGIAFSYFNTGEFLDEIDLVLNITVSVVDCLCDLFNAVFPMKALSNGVFDPCCIAMSVARAGEELIRLVLQMIVSIATIQTSGFCFWRLDPERCGIGGTNENPGGFLGQIGFVKQVDAVITTILTDRGGACSRKTTGTPMGCDVKLPIGNALPNCLEKTFEGVGAGIGCANSDLGDQGTGGIIGCMCSIVSAVIPIRPFPAQPVADGNCPFLDFCCLYRSISFASKDGVMYLTQGLVSFWQPAKAGRPRTEPSYFIGFIFCNEEKCNPDPTFPCNCGRLKIILDGFLNFLIGCPCQFFTILEAFLSEFLPIGNPGSKPFDCFCGEAGILCASSDMLSITIGKILDLVRVGFSQEQADPACIPGMGPGPMGRCYSEADVFWSPPDGESFTTAGSINPQTGDPGGATLFYLERTWAGTFFGPIADALCRLVSSALCFINRFFALPCENKRNRVVQSLVRWVLEIAIRAIAFIEGIVKVFVGEVTDSIAEMDVPANNNNVASFGKSNSTTVGADPLGAAISNLLQVFVDALIADSNVLCGIKANTFSNGVDPVATCACYNVTGAFPANYSYTPAFEQCTRVVPDAINAMSYPIEPPAVRPTCPGSIGPPVIFTSNENERCVPNRCRVAGYRIKCDLPDCGASIFVMEGEEDNNCARVDPNATFCTDHPLDGILISNLRYIQCMLGGPNGLGAVIKPLVVILSIFWQILGAIIRFFVALMILLFRLALLFTGNCTCHNTGTESWVQANGVLCYQCNGPPMNPCSTNTAPAEPRAGCSIFDIFAAIGGVFTSFVNIFESLTKIAIPLDTDGINDLKRNAEHHHHMDRHMEPVVDKANVHQRLEEIPKRGRRIPRQESASRARRLHGRMLYEPTSALEAIAEAMFDYDVSDCFSDPIACTCRNMHIEEMCTWHAQEGVRHAKRDHPVTVEDVLRVANEHMGDNSDTVCSHTIKSCAMMPWSTIPESERIEWVACMELRFQGERLNDLIPSIPKDMFYNKDGAYEWAHNLVHDLKRNVFVQAMHTGRWNSNARKAARADEGAAKWNKFLSHLHAQRGPLDQQMRNGVRIRDPTFIQPTVELAIIETKFRSGYYSWLLTRGYDNWRTGNWHGGSLLDAITEFGAATTHAIKTVARAPYADVVHSSVHAYHSTRRTINEVREIGFPRWWTRKRDYERTPKIIEAERQAEAKRQMVRSAFYNGPFYQWWNTTTTRTNGFKRLYHHVSNVVKHQRATYKRSSLNLFNFDLKFTQLRGLLATRFTPRWTQAKLENHEKINRVALKIYSKFQPDHIKRDMEERFLINGNCRIVDETWALVIRLFDYCIEEFVANIPGIVVRTGGFIESRLGKDEFLAHPNVVSSTETKRDMSEKDIVSRQREGKWLRPRVTIKPPTRVRFSSLPARAWRRIMVAGQPFDLLDWFLCLIEDLFDTSVSADAADLVTDIQLWLTNDNIDYVGTGGDVGLLYWLRFWIRCEFPLNLNCSVGIGFERAVGQVALWSLIVFVGLSLIFPATMLPLVGLGAFLFYVIVVPAVAWHYSPRCWLMTPTAAFGVTTLIPEGFSTITDFLITLGKGVNVPIVPYPVAFPALPECVFDEIIDFLDTYLTTCYDFLEEKGLGWLRPSCMINGDSCPPCDQKIDFANCKDVGIGDGVANLVYFVNLVFPGVKTFVIQKVATICFFNGCIADFFPFDFQYVLDLFDKFSVDVSATQECRLNWCFYATLPTIAVFFLFGILIFTLLQVLVTLVFEFIRGLWAIFTASPASILLLGNASTWVGAPGDQTTADTVSSRIGRGIGGFLESKESKRLRVRQMMMNDDNRWTSGLTSLISTFAFKPAVAKLKRD